MDAKVRLRLSEVICVWLCVALHRSGALREKEREKKNLVKVQGLIKLTHLNILN